MPARAALSGLAGARLLRCGVVAGLLVVGGGANWARAQTPAGLAASATPVGLWKTIDDETRVEKSLVRITERSGVYSGRVEKILDTAAKPAAVCELCTDERKGAPVLGLTILRSLKQDAEDPALWTGGDVLDPNNGKVYRVRLKPIDGGRKLELRGYIGPFYRTQTWLRVE